MRTVFFILALCIPMGLFAKDVERAATDTTIVVDGKRIEVIDGDERMKVRVYELTDENSIVEDELVFEGHYKDGRSYENRRRQNAIVIPLPKWNRHFDGHWFGFGMGFNNFADGSLHVNDIDGVSLRSEKSLEYNLNVPIKSFRISRRYNWGIVTGIGMRWNRYRLDENKYFKEVEGITQLISAPEGITYRKSRLNTTSITIPLLLEWQNSKRWDNDLFFSFGVVGVIKTASSSKVEYRDADGKKRKDKMDEGMNIRPINMDFLIQAGYDWIGIYMKYAPFTLFEGDKGPKVHPVSIGLQIYL